MRGMGLSAGPDGLALVGARLLQVQIDFIQLFFDHGFGNRSAVVPIVPSSIGASQRPCDG